MAIYHLTVKPLSKSKGQSAAAKFAYITRGGKYARQSDPCLSCEHMNMPAFAQSDVKKYWKATDKHERKNATLAREIEVALPRELSLEQQQELVQSFIARVAPSMPTSYAIHHGRGRNPHAHILISERVNDGIERSADRWFRRANPSDPKAGGAKKARLGKDKRWLQNTRKAWADEANKALKRSGHNIEIDHRSNKARGIREPPSSHVGMTWHSKDKTNPRIQKYRMQKRQRRRRKPMNGIKPTRTPAQKKGQERDQGIQIPDLKPTASGAGVVIWAWIDSGKAALIDKGDFIELATGSLAEWRRCAQLAKAKGWEGIHITCNNKRSAYDAIRAHLERGIPVTKLTLDGADVDNEKLEKWIKKVADDHNLTIPNSEKNEAEAQQEYVPPSKSEIKQAIYGAMLDYSKAADMLREANEAKTKAFSEDIVFATCDIAKTLASFMTENPTMAKTAFTQIIKALPPQSEKSADRKNFLSTLSKNLAHKIDLECTGVDEIMKKYGLDKLDLSEDEKAAFAKPFVLAIAQQAQQAQSMDMSMDMDMGA